MVIHILASDVMLRKCSV